MQRAGASGELAPFRKPGRKLSRLTRLTGSGADCHPPGRNNAAPAGGHVGKGRQTGHRANIAGWHGVGHRGGRVRGHDRMAACGDDRNDRRVDERTWVACADAAPGPFPDHRLTGRCPRLACPDGDQGPGTGLFFPGRCHASPAPARGRGDDERGMAGCPGRVGSGRSSILPQRGRGTIRRMVEGHPALTSCRAPRRVPLHHLRWSPSPYRGGNKGPTSGETGCRAFSTRPMHFPFPASPLASR